MACIRKNGKPRPQWTPEASKKQSLRVIGHLDRSSVTEEEIRDTFSKYGMILDIMIMKDDDWAARPHFWWAYVQYNDNEAAVLAKDELNGKILGGEWLSVECIRFDHTFARGCDTILVNYLDLSMVKGYKLLGFYKRFGSIRTFKLKMKRKGFNEGYAVIRYDKEKDAEVAVLNLLNNTFPYICRRERLQLMRERRSRSVCVTNLTRSDKIFHLRNAFEPYGTISKVNMVFDPYCEQSRCFAYVEFEKPEVASSAVGVQTRTQYRRLFTVTYFFSCQVTVSLLLCSVLHDLNYA